MYYGNFEGFIKNALTLPFFELVKCSFLAAMSSSRSDVVTHSVSPFVRLSVRNQGVFSKLKSFNGVSRKFKGCLKFKGRFKNVSGCFKEVSRDF